MCRKSAIFARDTETGRFCAVWCKPVSMNNRMEDATILLDNIEKVHTTEMGVDRIKRNLGLSDVDVVEHCKQKLLDERCRIYRQGKNWYGEIDNVVITVNAYSFTIITAHKKG